MAQADRRMSIDCTACANLAAAIVICFAFCRPALGAELPDPCKLLTPGEIHDTLRLADPVRLAPHPRAFRDGFAGFVDYPMPADDVVCVGIAGDARLFIRVRNAKREDSNQVRAEAQRERETVEEKLGFAKSTVKTEKTDSSDCREVYDPELLRKGQSEVTGMTCVTDAKGYELILGIATWTLSRPLALDQTKPIDNLRRLAEKAASRI